MSESAAANIFYATKVYECKEPRGGATVAEVNGSLITFGGVDREQTHYNDITAYSLKTKKWLKPDQKGDVPTPRSGHAVAHYGKYMFLYGGINFAEEVAYNDLYVLDTDSFEWKYVGEAGMELKSRNSHSLCVLSSCLESDPSSYETAQETKSKISYLVIYGGASPEEGPMGDTVYAQLPPLDDIDIENFFVTWTLLEPNVRTSENVHMHPGAREMHSTCAQEGQMIISGGRDGEGNVLSDVWVLRCTEESDDVEAAHREKERDKGRGTGIKGEGEEKEEGVQVFSTGGGVTAMSDLLNIDADVDMDCSARTESVSGTTHTTAETIAVKVIKVTAEKATAQRSLNQGTISLEAIKVDTSQPLIPPTSTSTSTLMPCKLADANNAEVASNVREMQLTDVTGEFLKIPCNIQELDLSIPDQKWSKICPLPEPQISTKNKKCLSWFLCDDYAMPVGRCAHGSACVGGWIYLVGGFTSEGGISDVMLRTALSSPPPPLPSTSPSSSSPLVASTCANSSSSCNSSSLSQRSTLLHGGNTSQTQSDYEREKERESGGTRWLSVSVSVDVQASYICSTSIPNPKSPTQSALQGRFGHCICPISTSMLHSLRDSHSSHGSNNAPSSNASHVKPSRLRDALHGGFLIFGGVCIENDFGDFWVIGN